MLVESNVEFNKEDIVGVECKHVQYVAGPYDPYGGPRDDLACVKEIVHLKDGSRVPRMRNLINFERPFWITREGFRNHEEKKEWEKVDKLQKFTSTQAELQNSIKRALRMMSPARGLRQLGRSPYLYGSDITSTAIIKRSYMDKYPDAKSENSVAVLDLETDVVRKTEEPIYGAITFKGKAIIVATKWFVEEFDDFEKEMKDYFYKRIPDVAEERNIKLEVKVVDTPLQLIEMLISKAHEWMPDFLAIWNMNFDIPKIIETIEKYGGNIHDIFSDPSVPKKFRRVWYKEGPSKKITQSGKESALHWADRWHTLYAPASFYVIDQAGVFKKLRMANGMEPSYALDAILQKYTDVRKLKNEKADKMSGLEWHVYMQQHEKLEYGVYNLFDCISCEILDEQPKVGDLRQSISIQCGHSDYDKFPSGPRRTVDDLHYTCLEQGLVIASTPPELKTEFDESTVAITEWIVTLPAHLIEDNGLQNIEELPDLKTLIHVAVYDLDVSAAYPNGEDVLNASKGTTISERVKIKGSSESTQRAAGINLTAGEINANEIMCSICKAPSFEMLLEDFEKVELAS